MKKIFFTLLLLPVFMFAGIKTDIKNPENKESMNATKLLNTETECIACTDSEENEASEMIHGCTIVTCNGCYVTVYVGGGWARFRVWGTARFCFS